MITREQRYKLIDVLWSPDLSQSHRVWAILDGARDERVYPTYLQCRLDKCCLYAGPLAPELELTAPYLVELDSSDRYTFDLLNMAWGQSWGIFLRTNARMDKLRKHLRQFLLVKDPRGKRMIFRYYDPRVFRVYLPTCFPNELKELFGPIDRFLLEGERGETLGDYRFQNNQLVQKTVELGQLAVTSSTGRAQ